jgi:hypothetical protein
LKKITLYFSILLVTIAAIIYSIRKYNYYKSKQPPATFKYIKPTLANNFSKFDTIRSTYIKKSPGISMSAVRIFKDSVQITGTYDASGIFSVIDSTRIQFKDMQNQYLDIYAGMPNGMKIIKVTNGKGEIKSIYATSFNGANEYFQLTSKNKLIIGYLWRISGAPLQFLVPGGITIKQSAIKPLPIQKSITESEVQIITNEGPIQIKPGEVKKFSSYGTTYTIYIQTSVYRKISDKGEDGITGYILHLIITQL